MLRLRKSASTLITANKHGNVPDVKGVKNDRQHMPPLTPEQVANAFRVEIPQMRSAFKRTLRDFRWDPNKAPNHNLDRVIDILEDETNARMAVAEKCVRNLLDSGWKPTVQESIKTVYGKIFQVRDHTQDPTSDLYAAADTANELIAKPSPIGLPNPMGQQTPRLRLGRIQVDAYNASIARSEAYVVKEPPHPGPVFHGPTQYVVGDGNTAHFTNVAGDMDARSILHSTSVVRQHINDFQPDDREDVEAHVGTVEEELAKAEPNQSRMRAAWRAVKKLAGTTANAALGAAIDAGMKSLMGGG